ncbi:hypothetical protein E2C01_093965 [Portunus trituberculatus]|uniref:Uncharacterized protein n=1 Tax=Portunus trituberculatus TaxID=210409 RepID=A0A5B7JR91_PORTR|nr:hypothetical protein [Portunus trituberculatus]
MPRPASGQQEFTRFLGDHAGGDLTGECRQMKLLHVGYSFHLHFVHHREFRHVTAMLEGVESWLLPITVPDKPCCSLVTFTG